MEDNYYIEENMEKSKQLMNELWGHLLEADKKAILNNVIRRASKHDLDIEAYYDKVKEVFQ